MSATFYFDLASPYSYLGAERVDGLFEDAGLERPTWRPILFGGLLKGLDRTPWGLTDERERHFAIIEGRAATYGLPPLAWPKPSPANSLAAMRAATVADTLGQVRPFALAAYRVAFAEGRDLGDPEVIAAVAEAVGIRAEIEAGIAAPETKARLRAATEEAADAGLQGVPTVAIGPDLFWGDDRLEEAVATAAR
ncbi:MAG TPA: DsbA family protein [Solirubrobacterales bacterium]|nr:DsbA family protein [Solirubrobacterales bacterium]